MARRGDKYDGLPNWTLLTQGLQHRQLEQRYVKSSGVSAGDVAIGIDEHPVGDHRATVGKEGRKVFIVGDHGAGPTFAGQPLRGWPIPPDFAADVETETIDTPSTPPVSLSHACTSGISSWQWGQLWETNRIAFGCPSLLISTCCPEKSSPLISGIGIPNAASRVASPAGVCATWGSGVPEIVTGPNSWSRPGNPNQNPIRRRRLPGSARPLQRRIQRRG